MIVDESGNKIDQVSSDEKIKSLLSGVDKPVQKAPETVDCAPYVEALSYLNPQAVLIERYTPPEKVGLIIKPSEVKVRENRSSVWGRILRISDGETDDVEILQAREHLKPGMWANFLVTNPIAGGFPANDRCQLIAMQDVLLAIDAKDFDEHVRDK
jgi:hypothetical protein